MLKNLVQKSDVQGFQNYITNNTLGEEAINYVFESGKPEIIKTYVNTVWPIGEEFVKYQDDVIRYGTRKTLATYYLYNDVTPSGEIELIKRDEKIPFLFYTGSYGLSDEAFEYLLKEGSEELIDGYLDNTSLKDSRLETFLSLASTQQITRYLDYANGTEYEEFLCKLKKMPNKRKALRIYNECVDNLFV